jgi:uncharacterized protein YndB with AHSA1/START domain
MSVQAVSQHLKVLERAGLVFEVWTEPEHLRHWWGPRGFALVVCEIDLRIGGHYRIVQRAPRGQDHGFHGEYREIDRPHRLVRTFVYHGAPEHESVETVTFQSEGGGTLVTGKSVFPSFVARDLYTRAGMEFGMRESHQRLDEWLDAIQHESIGDVNEQAGGGNPCHARR